MLILWPVFLIAVIAAFAGPLLMGGWAFSVEAMAFKLEKLNPVKGLGRVFSAKGLLELVKALVKFLLLLAATLLIFAVVQRDILSLSMFTPGQASLNAVGLLMWGLLVLSATMVFIVVFDVPFELWNHKAAENDASGSAGRDEGNRRPSGGALSASATCSAKWRSGG